MLGATVIAVFFIPMFYYVIESLSERFGGKKYDVPVGEAQALPGGGGLPAGAPRAPHEHD
jgi:multidrug efflux pump